MPAIWALFAVVVEGATPCPTPAAVEERLRSLAAGQGSEVARLSADEAGLRVTLVRADGSEAGSRTVAGEHSCDELADAAAVIIAAWQLEGAERARLPPPPPAPAPVAAAVAVERPAPASLRWELGVGAGASLSGADLAPAALLVGGISPFPRWGLAIRALVSGNRETSLPDGRASWRRALFAAGPHLRLPGARLLGELHLGAGLSWLAISGRGFPDARRHDDLVGGLEGGARLGWNRPGTRPWLELGVAFWPVRSIVYQLPDQRSAALPRLELLATLGLSFAR